MTEDRTSAYMRRLDERLKTLADDAARRRFLAAEVERFELAYDRFLRDAANDGPGPVTACANDYVATICAISGRLETLRRAA